MRKTILFIFFVSILSTISINAQNEKNIWSTLALLEFEQKDDSGNFDEEGNILPLIEAFEGKEVEVAGYVIPLSGKKAQSHFMFSAYPYASCFFCGKAGPETIMEVFVKDDKKIEFSEKKISIKGTFHFTSRNPNDVMFTLKNAEIAE
jgi:hypothetical protein